MVRAPGKVPVVLAGAKKLMRLDAYSNKLKVIPGYAHGQVQVIRRRVIFSTYIFLGGVKKL